MKVLTGRTKWSINHSNTVVNKFEILVITIENNPQEAVDIVRGSLRHRTVDTSFYQ